ncbi:hypothetical protein V6N13_071864 [Hibiscus sabdariffa]|uniref:Uncharacterized protein n=1 Tax=Hibiscus sabdariffa TaxID=183260 RepID=A0ABR2TCA1_9ROSI
MGGLGSRDTSRSLGLVFRTQRTTPGSTNYFNGSSVGSAYATVVTSSEKSGKVFGIGVRHGTDETET